MKRQCMYFFRFLFLRRRLWLARDHNWDRTYSFASLEATPSLGRNATVTCKGQVTWLLIRCYAFSFCLALLFTYKLPFHGRSYVGWLLGEVVPSWGIWIWSDDLTRRGGGLQQKTARRCSYERNRWNGERSTRFTLLYRSRCPNPVRVTSRLFVVKRWLIC